MSEQTGATDQQMSEAELRFLRYLYPHVLDEVLQGFNPNKELLSIGTAAKFIVPPGSKIVPADAVVVTPEIAATAAEALPRVIAFLCGYGHGRPQLAADIISMTDLVTALKAAAVALRGEG